MTDYYPLIARAIAGLDRSTGESRRVLYERARNALVAQLRNLDPPLSESEITRERLALEEAIRKIEGEAARQPARPLPPGAAAKAKPPAQAASISRRESDRYCVISSSYQPHAQAWGLSVPHACAGAWLLPLGHVNDGILEIRVIVDPFRAAMKRPPFLLGSNGLVQAA